MLSCGLGGARHWRTISSRAWANFDRLIGLLLGTVVTGFATINSLVEAVASGLSMTAVVDDPTRDRIRDCVRATQYRGRTIKHAILIG